MMWQETLEGIKKAEAAIPEELLEEALQFFHEYAETHLYFNGGDVLAAWRKRVGGRSPNKNWRNRWGAITMRARSAGVMKKVGRVEPKSKQSHTKSLALWQSLVYTGDDPIQPMAVDHLNRILRKVHSREMTVSEALWSMYEYAKEE